MVRVLLEEVDEPRDLPLPLVLDGMLLLIAREEIQRGEAFDFYARHVDLVRCGIHLRYDELVVRLGDFTGQLVVDRFQFLAVAALIENLRFDMNLNDNLPMGRRTQQERHCHC